MNKFPFILWGLIIYSCQPQTSNPTIDYLDQYFILSEGEKQGATYYYLKENINSDQELPNDAFFHDNRQVFSYLMWNLVDLGLPDSIRYSKKNDPKAVQNDYKVFLAQHKAIQSTFHQLLDSSAQHPTIPIDSLVSISERVHFAQSSTENSIKWSICAGKSIFPSLYGNKSNLETLLYQAFSLQAVFNAETISDSSAYDIFEVNIHKVSPMVNEVAPDQKLSFANQKLWEFMDQSPTYHNTIKHYFKNLDRLPFKVAYE